MQTVDQGKLFQTDAQLNTAETRYQKSLSDKKPTAENGYPTVLPSKPLDFIIDGDDIYVAQNGFVAQQVDLKTGTVKATFKGHTGPVTSLALYAHAEAPQRQRKILFTGSWDKTIKTWDIETQVLLSTSVGHVDFVKSIEIIPTLGVLVSGSTDRDIRMWTFKKSLLAYDWSYVDEQYHNRKSARQEAARAKASNLADTPELDPEPEVVMPVMSDGDSPSLSERAKWPPALYGPMTCAGTLKSHTRPIDALTSHPMASSSQEETRLSTTDSPSPYLLVSADTMGTLKVWRLSASSETTQAVLDSATWPHKTSINDMKLGCEVRHDIDHQTDAQLWTASADNSVLLSTLDLLPVSNKRVVSLMRLEQPYYVRCVLSVPLCMAKLDPEIAHPDWLITGSTDEDIRIYDLADLEDNENVPCRTSYPNSTKPTSAPTISNAWIGCLKAHWHEVNCLGVWLDRSTRQPWLISAGLDGTLRKWGLGQLQRRFGSGLANKSEPPEPLSNSKGPQMELTADEEAQLAELMDGLS